MLSPASCLRARFTASRLLSSPSTPIRPVPWRHCSRHAYSTTTPPDEPDVVYRNQYRRHAPQRGARREKVLRRLTTEKRASSRSSDRHEAAGYWHRVSGALKSGGAVRHPRLGRAFARGDKEEILRTCLELDLLKVPGDQGAQDQHPRDQTLQTLLQRKDLSLADSFVEMIKTEKLLPNLALNNAILSYYNINKEHEKVIGFTSWLIDHDKAYCNEETYAMSIVACAKQQRPRDKVEDLYRSALSWTNDQFREYHFSPEAILDDHIPRERLESWRAGLPLLDAIAIARMVRGDAKDAYKAVDTRCRLRPALCPDRVVSECILHRPPTEAFIIHQALSHDRDAAVVSAQAKIDTVTLLRLLRTAAESSDNDHTTGFNGNLLRSMFVVVYSRGGLLPSAHSSIKELLIGLACSADLLHGCRADDSGPRLTRLYDLAKRILRFCSGARAETLAPAFNKLISQAGKYHAPPQLLATILQDMSALNVTPTHVTMRALLESAWMSGSTTRVHSAWTHLVEHAEQAGNMPALADWRCLAKACADLGDASHVRSEMASRSHAVTAEISTEVEVVLKRYEKRKLDIAVSGKWTRDPESARQRLDSFDELIGRLEGDVGVLEVRTERQLSTPTPSPLVQIGIGAHPSWQGWYDRTEQAVRALFHQLTFGRVDGQARTTGPSAGADSTALDMSELRFQRWNVMNHVFAIAEAYEEILARRHKRLSFEETWSSLVWREPSAGLSDFIDEAGNRRSIPNPTDDEVPIPMWVRKARDPKEILRLRERTISAV